MVVKCSGEEMWIVCDIVASVCVSRVEVGVGDPQRWCLVVSPRVVLSSACCWWGFSC